MNKLTSLARKYRELEAKHEVAKKTLSDINTEWSDVETKLMEAFVEEGVNSAKLEGLGHFVLTTRNYLSVNAANKELYFDYLRKTGNDGILKLDVNPRTNGAFLDKHLETLIKTGMDDKDLNTVEARRAALEFLKDQGVTYFSEKKIQVRKL